MWSRLFPYFETGIRSFLKANHPRVPKRKPKKFRKFLPWKFQFDFFIVKLKGSDLLIWASPFHAHNFCARVVWWKPFVLHQSQEKAEKSETRGTHFAVVCLCWGIPLNIGGRVYSGRNPVPGLTLRTWPAFEVPKFPRGTIRSGPVRSYSSGLFLRLLNILGVPGEALQFSESFYTIISARECPQ